MQHALILVLVFGAIGLGGFGLLRLFRRPGWRTSSPAAVVDHDAARPARVWILTQTDDGPALVPGFYDPAKHGYTIQDAFFPQEFCKAVGQNTLVLATYMLMPADGNTAHGGDYEDLQPVPQAGWTAAWTDYDRARRRLNWDAVWSRGDGSLSMLKNIANGLTVVVLLILLFTSFGIKSGVSTVGDVNNLLVTQISLLTGTTRDGKPLPVAPPPVVRPAVVPPVNSGPASDRVAPK
jgi:hypothetical protein